MISGMSVIPDVCLANNLVAEERPNFEITHIKSLVLFYGANSIWLWGEPQALIPSGAYSEQRPALHQLGIIIRADAGLPGAGDYNLYLALMISSKRDYAINPAGERGLLLTAQPDAGQAIASGIRFFNGTWHGHCQTFVATAKRVINEETGAVNTSISLFYYVPGSLYNDGTLSVPPEFLSLGTYATSNKNSDPDVVISQEFSLPLPHEYYSEVYRDYPLQGDYAKKLSRELSIPDEGPGNTILPGEPNSKC